MSVSVSVSVGVVERLCRAAPLLLLLLLLAACSRRSRPAEAETSPAAAPPASRAVTAGPPPPRVYEQAPGFAPDYPAPPGVPEGSASAIPERYRHGFPFFGFVNRFHLADVDHHGTFIDFGTAHRFKYTLGDWAMGWAVDRQDARETYTWAIDDPRDGSPNANHRLYFFLDRPRPLVFRMRYRSGWRRTLTGNLNGVHGFRMTLEAGEWKVVEREFPVEALRDGENYLQLYEDRGPGEDLGSRRRGYFVVDWVWMRADGPDETVGEIVPTDHEVLREIALRDESGGEVTRPSLAVALPTTLSYFLEVPLGPPEAPTDPYIGFAYGTRTLRGDAASAATFEIGVTGDDGRRRVVWSRDVGPDREGRWFVASSGSLGSWGGQVVRIDFAVRGRPADGFRAVWGAPTLLVSQPPGAPARLRLTPRNVILLLIDTQRADHAEPYAIPTLREALAYRAGDVRTPALQALAEQGVVFDRALAPENWTLPSAATLLTGLHPLTHGAQRERDALAPEVMLLSQFLQKQGFKTAAFVANGHVSAPAGFDRGWDGFKNYVKAGARNRAPDVFRDAIAWIRANQGVPFFLYLHTADPHVPYDPPDKYLSPYDPGSYGGPVQARDTAALLERVKLERLALDERDRQRLHALYCGEVTYHDDALGEFWEALGAAGIADDTLLIVTADHGEEFFEHGKVGHGHSLFQELLHVPLLVRFPALPGGRHVAEPVGLADIAPTIVDLLNLGPAADAKGAAFEGNSLLPLLLGQRIAGPTAAFATHQGERMAVAAAGWKLVLHGPTQTALFRTRGEAFEELPLLPDGKWDWDALRDTVRAQPIVVRYLRILLGQFLGAPDRREWTSAATSETGARAYAPTAAQYDAETAARLREMGYLR